MASSGARLLPAMARKYPKDMAATATPCGGNFAGRLTNSVIDALRIAIIATPILFSLPQLARANPGVFSRLGPFSAVSRDVAQLNGVIDEVTPEQVWRMPVL
jgi:hypothetical protein